MKRNIGQDYGDIPDYPPLFARGTVEEEFVVVVGYEFIPGAWGEKQRGLALGKEPATEQVSGEE